MSDDHLEAERRRLEHAAFRARLSEAFRGRPRLVHVILLALVLCGLGVESADLWLGDGGAERLLLSVGLVGDRVVDGEWWRLISGTFLHRSWSHLLLNGLGLFLIGRYIEVAFGSLRFWWIYAGATLCGALGTMVAGHAISVGASGAVFGLIGAMVAMGLRLWPRLSPGLRKSLVLMPVAVLVAMLVLGLMADEVAGGAQIDHHAHLGGAFAGLLLGLLLQLQLRDADGVPLMVVVPQGLQLRRRALLAGGLALAVLFAGALGVAATHAGEPVALKVAAADSFTYEGQRVVVPGSYRRGLWRQGACRGALVDRAWALQTGRILCFELPMGGVMLVGRRDQLLTMDAGDIEVMQRANRSGELTWRQSGVLLYPLGAAHLYVVLGPDSMLNAYATALAGAVSPAGTARVGADRPVGSAPGMPRPSPPTAATAPHASTENDAP